MVDVIGEVPRLRANEPPGHVDRRDGRRDDGGEIEASRFGMLRERSLADFQAIDAADDLVEGSHTHAGEVRADTFGDEREVRDHVLRLARELRAQRRILGRDAHRAGVQVALAQHHAACGDERCSRHAVLFRAEQCGDDDIARRPQSAIDLDPDPIA